jgi:ribose transport system ATP-binding protein
MNMEISKNMSMAELPHMTNAIISERRERDLVDNYVDKLDIRLSSINDPVSSLSGGNQQKSVLGRWLATDPKLLILDEPTHGVDIGAKSEIYELMRRLANEGMGIILISSELPEVLALANRIVIMHEGRVTGIMEREDATEESVMAYATGLSDDFAEKETAEVVAE